MCICSEVYGLCNAALGKVCVVQCIILHYYIICMLSLLAFTLAFHSPTPLNWWRPALDALAC